MILVAVILVAVILVAVILVAVILVLVDRKCWQDLGKLQLLLERKTSLSCLCVALGNADGN